MFYLNDRARNKPTMACCKQFQCMLNMCYYKTTVLTDKYIPAIMIAGACTYYNNIHMVLCPQITPDSFT